MAKLTHEDKLIIEKINNMSHEEMAKIWRFAPIGHKYFNINLPYYAVFEKRFKEFGMFTPEISKYIGR